MVWNVEFYDDFYDEFQELPEIVQVRVSTLPDGLKSTLIDGCKRSGDFLLI
jgi:hypothetical protein